MKSLYCYGNLNIQILATYELPLKLEQSYIPLLKALMHGINALELKGMTALLYCEV